MKSLKIVAIVVLQVGMFTATGLAQTSQPAREPGQRVEKMVEQMKQRLEKLNLSADQKQKIESVLQAQKQAMQAWVGAHKADLQAMKDQPAEQRKAAMQKLMADRRQEMKKFHDQIRDILTPEQREQLKQEMTAARPGMAAGKRGGATSRPGMMAAHRMHEGLSQLNLTDDQKAKVKDILKTAREQAKNMATPQEKKDILTKAMDNVKTSVLTKDQAAKLDELRKAGAAARTGAAAGKGPFADLNLSDQQKTQVKQILTDARTQAQSAGTPEQKRTVRRQAMEKVLNTVLTPDQKAQFLKEHPRASTTQPAAVVH